jgi:serine/threonine protein kinase
VEGSDSDHDSSVSEPEKAAAPISASNTEPPISREQALQNADAWVGRTLDGRYRLEARLGAGGVGAVYRATQLNLNRTVAVKMLLEGLHPTFRARFEREARALATLRHPNIVTVTDFGVEKAEVDGAEVQTPYIVMELIEGETLHYRLQKGPLPPEMVQRVARQLLRALSFVHEQGLIHRDLKPGNVLIEKLPHDEERIRLLDFGLAKAMEPEGENVTRAGDVLGTPAYMAPEQVGGDQVDVRTDTYALGVLLFQMITGKVPFEGEPVDMLRSHIIAPPPSLSDKRPSITAKPELEAIIAKALAKKRDARFQTAMEMLAAIEAVEQPWLSDTDPSKIEAKTLIRMPSEGAPTMELPTIMHEDLLEEASAKRAPPPVHPEKRARSRRLGTIVGAGIGAILIAISTMGDDEEPAPVETPAAEARPAEKPPAALAEPAKPTEAPKVAAPPEAAAPVEALAIAPADVPREPPRNPWARPAPKNLAAARKAAASGDKGSERLITALRKYNREHQDDPRGHLVLALIFRNRNWRDDTLKQYETALERDIRVRGTPEMLRDLMQIVAAGESTGERATKLIQTVYGSEALPTIDQMLETSKVDAAGRLRWEALRALVAPN